jgi:8-oxo-dGTP diphosphatase
MKKDNQQLDRELHRIAITTIIYRDGKYLLLKRAPHKTVHPNRWTIPGGGLMIDDYINEPQSHGNAGWYGAVEKALTRELREEVGILVEDPQYFLDMTFIRPDNIPVLVLSYYAKYKDGEVKLDEDSTDFAWVSLEEAKNYDLIAGIYEELEMVDKIIKK